MAWRARSWTVGIAGGNRAARWGEARALVASTILCTCWLCKCDIKELCARKETDHIDQENAVCYDVA
jgi:hypothetical protein